MNAPQESSNSIPLPLHLKTYDLVGIASPQLADPLEDRLLKATYGLLQMACSGVPALDDSGRSEALVATLVRDATLANAAGIILVEKGLYEPAHRVARGLFEARLYVKRLRSDDAERVANLLTVARLDGRKRQLQRQIELGLRSPDDPWLRSKLKKIKDVIRADDALSGAKTELEGLKQAGKDWHGAKSLEKLAEQLDEASSYTLIYSPSSQMFVHPGDPDIHLVDTGTSVELRDLVCTEPEKLRSLKQLLITEAYELLRVAVLPWNIPPALREAIEKLIPLMLIAMEPSHTSTEARRNLEETSGIPDARWGELLHVTFDWEGPEEGDTRE